MFTQYAPLGDRLRRAAVSRGFSAASIEMKQTGQGRHVVTDTASGSWLEFDTAGWRVRVIGSGKKEA